MVLVSMDGLAAAARCGASLCAGADEVPELAAGDVARFGMPVIARALSDPRKGAWRHAQVREELLYEGRLTCGIWWRVRRFWLPRMATGSAGVGDRYTSLADDGEAPSGSGMA
jgi:hypothetical protein